MEALKLKQLIDRLTWKPKTVVDGVQADVFFTRPAVSLSVPEKPNVIRVNGYPVVRLEPPFDHLLALACPRCQTPLRGYGRGAPVTCGECGFPNIHEDGTR